jgi:hypothetical protein
MIVFDLVRAEKVNTTLRLSVVRHTTDPTHAMMLLCRTTTTRFIRKE